MDIKPFNEFIKSLTEEDRDYINECEDSINIDTSDLNFMENIAGYISSRGFGMSLRLLQMYHEWISEQL